MTRLLISAALLTNLLGGLAFAGPQYVDETGYAASGYDVVAFWGLKQAPVGQAQMRAIPGRAEFTAEYNGAVWAFSTAENRDRFLADPARYAPAYDGHCAYGVAKGGKVPANPNLWRIVNDRLFFNINPAVVGFWEEDIPGQISIAQKNWGDLESGPASDRAWTSIKSNDATYERLGPIEE